MKSDEFEWDDSKAQTNDAKHSVTFDFAMQVFAGPFQVEILDESEDYGEERYLVIGMVGEALFSVIYTPRHRRYRLISARRASKDEQDHYFIKNSEGEA